MYIIRRALHTHICANLLCFVTAATWQRVASLKQKYEIILTTKAEIATKTHLRLTHTPYIHTSVSTPH